MAGPSTVTIRGSVVERNLDVGILVSGSVGTIEGTAVRDIQPRAADQLFGRGIAVQTPIDGGPAASATVRSCLVERNREAGIFFGGAEGVVEDTAVLDTLATAADGRLGRGMGAQGLPDGQSLPQLTVRRSLVDLSRDIGVFIYSVRATLEQIVVQNTLVREADGLFGDGVTVMIQTAPPRTGRPGTRAGARWAACRPGRRLPPRPVSGR